jgi:hypothetical protein
MSNELSTEEIARGIRDWVLKRAADKNISREDARALVAEFYEWVDPEEDFEIYSLNRL